MVLVGSRLTALTASRRKTRRDAEFVSAIAAPMPIAWPRADPGELPGEDRPVRLDVDPMQRARRRPVVRCRLVQREVQGSPQARRVGRLLALVGIATLSVSGPK